MCRAIKQVPPRNKLGTPAPRRRLLAHATRSAVARRLDRDGLSVFSCIFYSLPWFFYLVGVANVSSKAAPFSRAGRGELTDDSESDDDNVKLLLRKGSTRISIMRPRS